MFKRLFKDANAKYIHKLLPVVARIAKYEKEFVNFTKKDFQNKTKEFKQRIANGETLDDILEEAYALCRIAAYKTIGEKPYDEQIMTGIVLHRGAIAEMKTGEGKTLAATMPLYLNALKQSPVYLVTVNDYLAMRDVNWMGPIYDLLGMTTACLQDQGKAFIFEAKEKPDNQEVSIEHQNLKPVSRQEAYKADIVYGTNAQFGFDYLRDNMVYDISQIVQAKRGFVILDEIDSILIDEARTPLIISAPDVESTKLYQNFAKIVPKLVQDSDYIIDRKHNTIRMTDSGIEKINKLLGIDIYKNNTMRLIHHLEQALRAQALFEKDKDYIVKNGKVFIIDNFTGRIMPDRRFSGGLHQALEAKEGVELMPESRTLATITLQNYFRLYEKLSGMTGTAATSAEEFHKVYNLDVIVIPTHKPMQRKDLPDLIYATENAKFNAVVEKIKNVHKTGQPILIGTTSISKNEKLSRLLNANGVQHNLLNAKHHEQEAQIIAMAGKIGAITLATNMAGRGVDIVLGGEPPKSNSKLKQWETEHNKVVNLGGLFVLGTERHESRRIDNQLRGRSGRQGDPGTSQFYVSLEDDLMQRFGSGKIKNIMNRLKFPADQPIEHKMVSKAIERAQAQIEGYNFDIRKHTLEYDNLLNKQRETIYSKRKSLLKIKDALERQVKLRVFDSLWLSHLEAMDYLRDGIGLRAYGQQDPLVEYKKEGTKLFNELLSVIKQEFKNVEKEIKQGNIKIQKQDAVVQEPELPFKKVRRNDLCPCGSGKKYKKCCWPKYGR